MDKQMEHVKKTIVGVLPKYGIRKAALFGSFARGEATEKSDIDLLIEFGVKSSLLDLVGLKQELEEILKKNVDVITYKSLHPLLKEKILKDQVKIYEKRL